MMLYKDVYIQLVDTPPVAPDMIPSGLLGTIREGDALLIVIDVNSGECLDQLEGTLNFLKEKNIISHDRSDNSMPYLIAATKADLEDSSDNLQIIKEMYPEIKIYSLSTIKENLEFLKELIFKMLNIIRIYSKAPGKEPDMEKPFTLKRGSTILDLAEGIHKDFRDKLKNAYVWGSTKFDGQAVPKDYILEDKDIVELEVN